MGNTLLPIVTDADALGAVIDHPRLCVVALTTQAEGQFAVIPGTVFLDPALLARRAAPALGLVPESSALAEALARVGIGPDMHVVAYDNEGGTKACRLLWTLELVGHPGGHSWLDASASAWSDSELPTAHAGKQADIAAQVATYPIDWHAEVLADRAYILSNLDNTDVVFLDVRSPGEYAGSVLRSARGGHIPGAVNVEWREALDPRRGGRLRPAAELLACYRTHGVTPEKEIVVYCHSHQRSAHTFVVLRSLGFTRLRAYAGAWSEWGNTGELPTA
jgi:thiosulfate/3-mercaptopyruvate sulfurtransferase